MSQQKTLFSIENNGTRIQYIATGGETSFPFPFDIFEINDLEVYLTPAGQQGNPNADILTYGVDYSIQTFPPSTFPNPGNVILNVAALENDIITINRSIPYRRETSYEVGAEITGKQLDVDFDRITGEIQQVINIILNQGLTYEVTDYLVDRTENNIIPILPANTPGKINVWSKNTNGKLFAAQLDENIDASSLRAELLSQNHITPGSSIVGHYDLINLIGRTVSEQLNLLTEEIKELKETVWRTGDIKLCFRLEADEGWILYSTGTIGNAASGATVRANGDTENLFVLLWETTLDGACPVSGGRGASALDDFNANKTISLPDINGRVFANNPLSGTILSKNINAFPFGSATATLSVSNLPAHSHPINDPGHTHNMRQTTNIGAGAPQKPLGAQNEGTGTPTDIGFTGISVGNTGSGTSFSINQLSLFCSFQLKL